MSGCESTAPFESSDDDPSAAAAAAAAAAAVATTAAADAAGAAATTASAAAVAVATATAAAAIAAAATATAAAVAAAADAHMPAQPSNMLSLAMSTRDACNEADVTRYMLALQRITYTIKHYINDVPLELVHRSILITVKSSEFSGQRIPCKRTELVNKSAEDIDETLRGLIIATSAHNVPSLAEHITRAHTLANDIATAITTLSVTTGNVLTDTITERAGIDTTANPYPRSMPRFIATAKDIDQYEFVKHAADIQRDIARVERIASQIDGVTMLIVNNSRFAAYLVHAMRDIMATLARATADGTVSKNTQRRLEKCMQSFICEYHCCSESS